MKIELNDGLTDYLKSLNPKKDDQAILIYGSNYHLWREGKYLGIATWTKDDNIGDSFQESVLDEESGHIIQQVFTADKWELIIGPKTNQLKKMIHQTFKDVYRPELAGDAIINNRHPGFKEDYLIIHSLIKQYKPASIFEIGTNGGFGTRIIKNAIGEGEVFSMDLPEDVFHRDLKFPEKIGQECDLPYRQLFGDSLTFNYSDFPCESYFVDGAHDYEHVFHETKEILKLSPKLIIFHDADIQEVALAIADAFDLYGEHYAQTRVVGTRILYAERLTKY